jgi:hypothetical protein
MVPTPCGELPENRPREATPGLRPNRPHTRYLELRNALRTAIAAATALALLGATPVTPLTVSAQLARTSLDLLDSLGIVVVVHNASQASHLARFAQPSEYAIDVMRDGNVFWTSLPPSPPPNVSYPVHTHSFAPGPTTLVIYEWNGVAHDGWCPPPGSYDVRVRLLDGSGSASSIKLTFARPLPIAGVVKLKPNEEATISGTLDAMRATMSDDTGAIGLARRLTNAPLGTAIVARGYASNRPDGSRQFAIERWAPLGPPSSPSPAPAIAPSPRASFVAPPYVTPQQTP